MRIRTLTWTLLLALPLTGAAKADDERKTGWFDSGEISYVVTAGNSETNTLGLKNELTYKWTDAWYRLRVGGVRAQSTTTARTAIGTPDDFQIVEDKSTDLTAENYYVKNKYARNISPRLFWSVGAGWDRNRPAGIDNRYIAEGGVGNTWVETDRIKFRTEYAVTYTDQKDVVETPGRKSTFAGARVSWDYFHKFFGSTTYTNDTILDYNFDESDAWRGDMTNAVSVTINDHLALKVALQWLYENRPALKEVPLFDAPGGAQTGTVLVELDSLDSIFTTSLVVNF